MAKAKTPKQLALRIKQLRKQVADLEKKRKKAVTSTKKKPKKRTVKRSVKKRVTKRKSARKKRR
jgi:hypothetical protein|tara:strand:+ start:221 stop:412 length:192 start_codon:yes stop_codon:yes gene_type:complete